MQQGPVYELSRKFYDFMVAKGVSEELATQLNLLVNLIAVAIVVFLLDWLFKKVVIRAFAVFSSKTKTTFDDFLVQSNFPKYLAHIIPMIFVIKMIPVVLSDFPGWSKLSLKAVDIYMAVLAVWIFRSFLRSLKNYLRTKNAYKDKPLDSFVQVFLIIAWIIASIYLFTVLTEKDPITFLTALGAASAVILLIFKDSILGFVASIQVAANDMVRIGDWITVEKYGADGDVMEINLATVKVCNFDKTITTIPTYALISDSFRNWRGMQDSGGRRIKRALNIAVSSIRYLTEEEVEDLKKIHLLASYLDHRQTDIIKYNTENNIDKNILLNGRNQTNLGVFRKYIDTYIKNHPAINKDMTMMVRHLPPTAQGIPLEIYIFSSDKRWVNYEHIMADIFEHILAAVPYFDLEIYESPSSKDMKRLSQGTFDVKN
ncbi:mechanosensitive ion channel family protein [Sinomicrobium weinanense]|uniref:Mechanosensitive ion channel n=1 Tax=Sinomicrobium weinanense TaxID=2842200 RepID=A0A926JU51_9FLAO|nr:mechanosensitive ion channel domain-containing protein [Sinomicrobium weinanense]MBC9797525.1 mechanosensitive ion channel [Sinomicrobium weinanense]MBU3122384.1 mechanosensitive ion channel family protein [Sinomicrobium weinanense]